jgi:two-component system LytT family response regulator
VQSVLQNTKNPLGRLERLAVPSAEGIDFYDINDIIFMKADDCYTHIFLTNQQPKLVTKVLKDFDELLADSGFCRVHNSFLINLKHVKSYVRGEGGYVILTGNHHVDISRRRKEEFLSQVKIF